jgi:hypothetical protein
MPDDPAAVLEPRCTWCSAVLPPDHTASTCPSCGATLKGEAEAAVPGLTAIDADAILRNARGQNKPKSRGRLLGWISGDYEGESAEGAAPGSLAPPPVEVRREMLRLELEAQVANAQAEVEAMAADAAIESGRPLKSIEEMVVAADVADGIEADAAAELAPLAAVPAEAALEGETDTAYAVDAVRDADPTPAADAPSDADASGETPSA